MVLKKHIFEVMVLKEHFLQVANFV